MLKRVPVPDSSKPGNHSPREETSFDWDDPSPTVTVPSRSRRTSKTTSSQNSPKQTVPPDQAPAQPPVQPPPSSGKNTPPPIPEILPQNETPFDSALVTIAPETPQAPDSDWLIINTASSVPPRNTPTIVPKLSASDTDTALAALLNKDNDLNLEKNALNWLTSLFVHLLILFPLLFLYTQQDNFDLIEIISQPGLSEDLSLTEVYDPGQESIPENDSDLATEIAVAENVVTDSIEPVTFFDDISSSMRTMPDMNSLTPIPLGETTTPQGIGFGNEFAGRGKNRGQLVASGGGSEGSEKAVALALAWIAEHQQPNGSWTFDNNQCYSCQGRCRNSGSNQSAVFAATGLALLPFLAAGNTPAEGKFKKVVRDGIRFLLQNGNRTPNGLSFIDAGNMYSHGICTIVLCEAYAMTSSSGRSKVGDLGSAAIAALKFTEYAQDPVGGGWRYQPRQPGDTSVLGWQIMALKSGQYGQLANNGVVFQRATSFLVDSVGSEYGTQYGYSGKGSGTNATNAIGLLCRIMLDWKTTNPYLIEGANRLLEVGPDFSDPYYTYYATQLFHHIGGEQWTKWNRATRDPLIAQQAKEGHERGSWYPATPNSHCPSGGRLYATALNCMTLEVYYRHLPIYQTQDNTSTSFPVTPVK